MSHRLLKKNELPLEIEIHSDPLCILPAALSKKRAFKPNRIVQEEAQDNPGGPGKCRFCNPDLLDGKPPLDLHLGGKVMSFKNAAPFLPGDQRVVCLWHESPETRYAHAHKFKFSDFCLEEFYYLAKVGVELARSFPDSQDGKLLQEDTNLIRCVAGFNIGKLAGQSIPHFHLQYGWEIVLDPKNLNPPTLQLYYWEMREAQLILHEDAEMMVVVPWTPKGQYHIELHFKDQFHFGSLKDRQIDRLACFAEKIIGLYRNAGIQNMNILFTESPQGKHWEPLRVQFVPRVNMTALYEMIGVNVVDTPPEQIAAFFSTAIRWSDVSDEAERFDPTDLYRRRFETKVASGIG